MRYRQKTDARLLSVSIGILIIFLSGCGGDSGTSSDLGSMRLEVKWKSALPAAVYAAQAPSGDVCVDFEIDSIDAKLYDSSDSELAAANWPCSDHQGTLARVPAGSGLRVVVAGIVSGTTQWQGEAGNITLSAGENKQVDITMNYIGEDETSPGISATNLSESAVDVPIDTVITATFTEKIVAASVNTSTFTLATDAGPVGGSVTYDPNSLTATFTPSAPLYYNTKYTATITDGVMDIAGVTMGSGFSRTFSTAKIVWLGIDGAIVKFSTAQEELVRLDSVNCRSLSGYSQFAVNPNDNSLWISDTNSDRVMKMDDAGQLLLIIDQWSAEGTVVDPRDGTAWSSKLYQNPDYNRTMVNHSALGFTLRETAGGLDASMMDNTMGWNSSDHSIWYANYGTDVVKLINTGSLDGYDASGPSGTNHTRIGGFGQAFEVSVFSGSNGSANASCVYVADRDGYVVQLDTNGNEVWRADPTGISEVRYISADPIDGSLWIGGLGTPWRVAKYAYDGTLLVQAAAINDYFDTIETDPMDGGLWVGGRNSLIRLDASGVELWRYAGRVQSIAFSMDPDRRDKIHVASTGDDASGDGSLSSPFLTIGKALTVAADGDSICVADGKYNEDIILTSNVKIVGSGAETTTIMGLGNNHVVEGIAIANVTVSGFTITGSGDSASGVYLDECRNVILRSNIIQDNGNSTTSNGIVIQGTSEALIEKNTITGNADSGMYISSDSAAIVRNNIIAGNGDTGIYRGYGNRVSYIINNVIDRNGNDDWGRSGIMMGSSDIISNNIISNNGMANPNAGLAVGIYVIVPGGGYPAPTPTLSHNNVWNNYQGDYTNIAAGPGDISADPQFENPTNGVYRLNPGSTSINSGDPDLYDPDCSPSDQGAYGGPFGNW
jgi:parallel beta-helix repeat protein